ncbi:MAG: ERCC4 domain-containing protein [Candidatus Nanoarchaeia archaeon]|nr:ERCC4 domain-containing protein [Candidatus Nanoarchaeia archaeon]
MIIVDNREFRSKTVKELFKNGIDISPGQLSVGDYIIGDVCIERKSLKDFYDSIIDKRIFEQLKSIKSNYEKRLLIIEGESGERNIHPNAIKGMIASIMIDYKIPIIFLKNPQETAEFLGVIEKRMQKKIEPIIAVKKEKNDYDSAINMLCSIPGIGLKNANKLIEQFKSIKKILCADEISLAEILGEKSAKNLIKLLDKEF